MVDSTAAFAVRPYLVCTHCICHRLESIMEYRSGRESGRGSLQTKNYPAKSAKTNEALTCSFRYCHFRITVVVCDRSFVSPSLLFRDLCAPEENFDNGAVSIMRSCLSRILAYWTGRDGNPAVRRVPDDEHSIIARYIKSPVSFRSTASMVIRNCES